MNQRRYDDEDFRDFFLRCWRKSQVFNCNMEVVSDDLIVLS